MANCKLSWVLVIILSVSTGFLSLKFFTGEVKKSDDGRLALQLSVDERNMLLLEMRDWLRSTQGIFAAAINDDMAEVGRIATKAGMEAEEGVPGELFQKIPLAMKKLGFGTREAFDEIATIAAKDKDKDKVIKKLTETMNNCIACHDTYRFSLADGSL